MRSWTWGALGCRKGPWVRRPQNNSNTLIERLQGGPGPTPSGSATTPRGQRLQVDGARALRGSVGGEEPRPRLPGRPEPRPEGGIGRDPNHRIGKGFRISRGNEDSGVAVRDDFGNSPHLRRHDREPGRHRVERGGPHALQVGRHDEEIGRPEEIVDVLSKPEEANLGSQPEGLLLRLEGAPKGPFAGDPDAKIGRARSRRGR